MGPNLNLGVLRVQYHSLSSLARAVDQTRADLTLGFLSMMSSSAAISGPRRRLADLLKNQTTGSPEAAVAIGEHARIQSECHASMLKYAHNVAGSRPPLS